MINSNNLLKFTKSSHPFFSTHITVAVDGLAIINLQSVNDAPESANQTVTTTEDNTIVISLVATDVDNMALLTTIVNQPTHGTLTPNADGTYTYSPTSNFFGADSFSYMVNDGELNSSIATVNLLVTAINDAPVVTHQAVILNEDSDIIINVLATDIDSSVLSTVLISQPANGTLTINADGSYHYVPNSDFYGVDSFSYKVSDGELDSTVATVSITIAPVNDAPIIAPSALTVTEDGRLVLDLVAQGSDVDGDTLTIASVGQPEHGVIEQDVDGNYYYIPTANYFGSDSFSFTLTDGTVNVSGVATIAAIQAVNDAPLSSDQTVTTTEDNSVVINLVATDVDSTTLTTTIVNAPTHGTLTRNANGTYSYSPADNFFGGDSFSYVVNDGELNSRVATVNLVVTAVNDAPVSANQTLSTVEDNSLVFNLTATDIDSANLSNIIVNQPSNGTLRVNANGSYIYTPNANFFGVDSFIYNVTDGELSSGLATVSINVTPVNDAPVISPVTLTLAEDGRLVLNLTTQSSDVDGDTLTIANVGQPQHGTITQNANGDYIYVPNANYVGTDSFNFSITDGIATVPSVATVSLQAVNDAPESADQTVIAAEDNIIVISLVATDVDSTTLTTTIVNVPIHGTLTRNTNGTYSYSPAANFFGGDSFSYVVNDGELNSRVATVSLVVTAVNDASVALNDSITTAEDTPVVINVLANDYDVDSTVLTTVLVTGAAHGQVTRNSDGSFSYSPTANFYGTDSFSYRIDDEGLHSTVATVTINVTPVNDAPTATPLVATLLEDGSLVIDLGSLTHDVDGDALSYNINNPQLGALTRTANGIYTYRPNANVNGVDNFSYTVSDDQVTSTSTIRLTITAVNDAPVAVDDAISLNEDTTIHFNPLANDSDAEGDRITLRILTNPTHGQITINADQTVNYTASTDYSGTDSFTYQLNDGQANSQIATVRLTIAAIADAPILTIDTSTNANASRELFRTGWETVDDRNYTSTLVEKTQLEGWTLLTKPDNSRGGSNGFEVWSTDDRMADNLNRQRTVTAMAGNGNNWLELNNARNDRAQSLGIQRQVDTVLGASYTLSMDVAGRLGYSSDYTKIGIYVDGVRIGGDESTSSATALNWQAKQFTFTGTGRKQTIQIIGEATKQDGNGRGMMIDDIALVERLPANIGLEDTAIKLSAITARLKDTDGSETLALSIEAIPVGAVLTDGTRNFMATANNTTATVTGWNLANLSLTPPKDFYGRITLQVVATATERSNGSSNSTRQSLVVTILPVNDAPQAQNATYTLASNGTVPIDFGSLVADVDGDALALSFCNPSKGTLSKNSDGTWTYTPKRNTSGTDSFTYTVSDGITSTTATITLNITKAASGNGNNCGYIVVQSGFGRDHKAPDYQYVVMNTDDDDNCNSSVNWTGCASDIAMRLQPPQSVLREQERSLAELTGLVVRRT